MKIDVELHRRNLAEVTLTPPLWRRIFLGARTRSFWVRQDPFGLWFNDATDELMADPATVLELRRAQRDTSWEHFRMRVALEQAERDTRLN